VGFLLDFFGVSLFLCASRFAHEILLFEAIAPKIHSCAKWGKGNLNVHHQCNRIIAERFSFVNSLLYNYFGFCFVLFSYLSVLTEIHGILLRIPHLSAAFSLVIRDAIKLNHHQNKFCLLRL